MGEKFTEDESEPCGCIAKKFTMSCTRSISRDSGGLGCQPLFPPAHPEVVYHVVLAVPEVVYHVVLAVPEVVYHVVLAVVLAVPEVVYHVGLAVPEVVYHVVLAVVLAVPKVVYHVVLAVDRLALAVLELVYHVVLAALEAGLAVVEVALHVLRLEDRLAIVREQAGPSLVIVVRHADSTTARILPCSWACYCFLGCQGLAKFRVPVDHRPVDHRPVDDLPVDDLPVKGDLGCCDWTCWLSLSPSSSYQERPCWKFEPWSRN
jgi:hypothetical protein